MSDRGPQFNSQVWQSFCSALGASVSLSLGYHPQSNGQTERTNQSLESMLRCVTARHPAAWSSCLPWVEYAHNSLVSAVSGVSPFMASLGYQPPLFEYQEEEVAVLSVVPCCRRFWRQIRSALLRSSLQVQRQANRRRVHAPSYQPGQRVLFSAKDLLLQTEPRKLMPQFMGLFQVDWMVNIATIPAARIHQRPPYVSRCHGQASQGV